MYVLLYPNSKVPVGQDWANHTIDEATLARRLEANPAAGVGLLLGPVSGLIDIECDGEEATAAYKEQFGTIYE